ncbi:MAG: bifunctional phosphopantothenoylcysteine decarboxylase/phosphopantothenate--cysteine ligase CoaBC, partial [Deltaproteobacteria bacterium]|nr:bifunctional phosphopantothenoylcysteine decarboxylase/phosphopantothenate--cysteine ligase CoaBC [Deltaproteobacteria bacterium]
NATKFITPLTFETLSGNRVIWDMFGHGSTVMDHITRGQDADLIIIAPATANFIAKMAHGIGDDFLSTMVIAATVKIMVCPSMNSHMFLNAAVQDNIRLLKQRGYLIMEPAEGELACGTEGPGRLPEPEDILERARILLSKQDISGLRVLVTAGATVEPIDPVRFMTNRSGGKMGYALARAARLRGAEVTLVSGPTNLKPPNDVTFYKIKTTEEMRRVVFEHHRQCDVIIKAAAVLDYRPRKRSDHKIKKDKKIQILELVQTPDILAELGRKREDSHCLLVGFAAETEDLLENATKKLRQKNLDMIVANDVSREDAGFESDTNLVTIIDRHGLIEDLPLMTKQKVADHVLDRIKGLWEKAS